MTKACCYLLLPFLICFSCSSENVPDNIAPPEKMEAILWDLIRADELTGYRASLDTTVNKEKEGIKLYGQILTLHDLSEADFKRSFAYYEKHPQVLKTVFDSLRLRSDAPVPAARFRRSID